MKSPATTSVSERSAPGWPQQKRLITRTRARCLLAFLSLLFLDAISAKAERTDSVFDQYEIASGSEGHKIVLPGFFSDGAVAELAVVSSGEGYDPHLRIYRFQGNTWVPVLEKTLSPEVLFVDVGKISGSDHLITHEPGRLNRLDIESGTEQVLVAVPSDFNAPPGGEVRHVDVTRDLNRDGHDDLVIPASDGVLVFVQDGDGGFANPVKVGHRAPFSERGVFRETVTYGELGWTALTNRWNHDRIREMDYNGDGRNDLVFWRESGSNQQVRGHFEVHLQDGRGLFDEKAEAFNADVEFDSDGLSSLIFRNTRTASVLHSMGDLNGDQITDLTTLSLEGNSVLKERSVYAVHFGRASPDGRTVFPSAPDTVIRSKGMQVGIRHHEFGGDGQIDVAFSNINLKFFKILRGLITRSMSFELHVYRMKGGVLPDTPNAIRRIKWSLRGGAFCPAVLIGDVNGDKHSDLLIGRGRNDLLVFLGEPGPGLFARRPKKVRVAMPRNRNDNRMLRIYTYGDGPWVPKPDEEFAYLADLNRDSKQDLIVHHPAGKGPDGVTILLAR